MIIVRLQLWIRYLTRGLEHVSVDTSVDTRPNIGLLDRVWVDIAFEHSAYVFDRDTVSGISINYRRPRPTPPLPPHKRHDSITVPPFGMD